MFEIPNGFCNIPPKPAYYKKSITDKILECFSLYSYKRIETPLLENFSLCSSGEGGIPQNELFKVNDLDGEIYVLRPSCRLAVAKYAVTCGGFPSRYAYDTFVYNAKAKDKREKAVAGACITGINDTAALAEIISVAVQALTAAGLKNITLRAGHPDVLDGIFAEAKASPEAVSRLKEALKSGQPVAPDIIAQLPSAAAIGGLKGGVEALNEASKLAGNKRSLDAVLSLYELYYLLIEYKLPCGITFDLGVQPGGSRGRGVFFSLECGSTILAEGERDERLLSKFGRGEATAAVEFDVEEIFHALSAGEILEYAPTDIVIAAADCIAAQSAANAYAKELTAKGFKIELLYNAAKTAVKEYILNKKIENAIYVNEQGKAEGI